MRNSYISHFKKLQTQRLWFENKILETKPESLWNHSQIIDHFVAIEEAGIANYKKYSHIEQTLGFKETLNSFLLNSALRLPFKFSAPNAVSKPENVMNTEKLYKKWTNVRNELYKIVESYPASKKNTSFFKHPKTGLMTF